MNYTDRIKPDNKGLTTYLDDLLNKNYQIPTFQRDVVWSKENVKKLWDSIYKFYPLGSILIWKTDLQLQNHRQIGGHLISDPNFNRTEYQYILDGQQRTTSLLTSLYGGSIDGRNGFDPTLYVDLTIEFDNDVDDESYKDRFLFWDEIDSRNDEIRPNIGKHRRFESGLIVKLIDITKNFTVIQNNLFNNQIVNNNFDHPYLKELAKLKAVLDNYRLSFIEVKGIQVSEVCQIFERINQAGKPLDIFDIVVAKTFKPVSSSSNGFYLRELIENFRKNNEKNNSAFLQISDIDYLQTLAVLINRNINDSGVRNITDRYLNDIKTEHIISLWNDAQTAISKTFDFFENHLHIMSPNLIPFRYFYFTITAYFFRNSNPNYDILKKYFWYYSFHNEDLLSNTTNLFQHIDFLDLIKHNKLFNFNRFLIDKEKLRSASYSSKGRISRAILSLFANQEPHDWEYCDRKVIAHNIFFSTDKPNLHHIFPTNSDFVKSNRHKNKIDSNSLMNIAYLTQITNLNISNNNPLDYISKYDKPEFTAIMKEHFLPDEIINWAREDIMPDNSLDLFIEKRVTLILDTLKSKLNGIPVEIIDTML